jgi:hypothetical protein
MMTAMTAPSSWSDRALRAFLDRLAVSTVTEARHVIVERAWAEGDDAFCVVYRPPFDPTRTVGLRRHRCDAMPRDHTWKLGDLSPSPYIEDPEYPDAVAFGKTVADFDIGEPMGNTVDILRDDASGIGWWGTLGPELPRQ